jgi:hypothetical protein
MKYPKHGLVKKIRDVYPGSWIRSFPSRIPDQKGTGFQIPDPQQRILLKKLFLSFRKCDRGRSSWNPDMDFFPIPDPGSRGQKSTGSRIQIHNSDINEQLFVLGEELYPQINSTYFCTSDTTYITDPAFKKWTPDLNIEHGAYPDPTWTKVFLAVTYLDSIHDTGIKR